MMHYVYSTLTSTQHKAIAMDTTPMPFTVRALRQTLGEGRGGNTWYSPLGNVYMSIAVPVLPMPCCSLMSYGVGVAIHHVLVTHFNVKNVVLKWPNDVLVQGAKIAGCLITVTPTMVVIGLGLNIHHAPQDTPYQTTTLLSHTVTIDIDDCIHQLVQRIYHYYTILKTTGFDEIRRLFLKAAHPKGTPLILKTIPPMYGLFDSIDIRGRLVLNQGGILSYHTPPEVVLCY
jgi:BirA family transcriptional regulator, biotin operon repressor / biotin---[acetyl-CoA-carboxylase] ligase